MTSFIFRKHACENQKPPIAHMLDPDVDGNVFCSRPGCGYVGKIVCTCTYEPEWTKYIGCPTHTQNPRMIYPNRFGNGGWWCDWYPENSGGDLSQEEADRCAAELITAPRMIDGEMS